MADWPDEVEMVIDVCDDPPRPFLPRDLLDPEGAWRESDDYLTETYLSLSKVRERLEQFATQLEAQTLEGDGPSDLTAATIRAVKAQGIRDALAASFPEEDPDR